MLFQIVSELYFLLLGLVWFFISLIYLFYIMNTVSPPFSPSIPSPTVPLCLPNSIHSPMFLFGKGQASHEYPQSLTCQVAGRFSTFPFI